MPESTKEVIVIIPAYNEGGRIAQVLCNVKKAMPQADLLVIDDGSTDTTEEESRRFGAGVVSLMFNMGYGVALQTGYKYAKEGGYRYILQIDADGQHEPEYLNNILKELKLDSADVIIGSRFMGTGSYRPTIVRRVGMLFFSFLTSIITKQKISDSTSGFLGFNHKVLEFLTSEFFPIDYPDADSIVMIHRYGFRIKEVPVVMKAGTGKTMHSGLKPVYYVFKMLLSVFVTLLRKYR
ncbi:MAG: glycosyltransferase family 2 protein [Candidatus Hydrogenedentota bacterium]